MAAAIIEFDSLADPVGTAAENDDFLPIAGRSLVFFFVGGIEVWRVRLEFGCARVYTLVHRHDAVITTLACDFARFRVDQTRDARIGKSRSLSLAQKFRRQRSQRVLRKLFDEIRDFLQLIQEPRIDMRQLDQFRNAEAVSDSMEKVGNAIRSRRDELLPDEILIDLFGARFLAALE